MLSDGLYTITTDLLLSSAATSEVLIIFRHLLNGGIVQLKNRQRKNGVLYNFTLNSSLTSTTGRLLVNGLGDPNGIPTIWAYDLFITPSGTIPLSSTSFL